MQHCCIYVVALLPINSSSMKNVNSYEVIIIGGSFAGLSAAMSLGRSLRKTLIIDEGQPCNSQTPHAHNFLTQDGSTPQEISRIGRQQVEKYETISFHRGLAATVSRLTQGFSITTQNKETFYSSKLIFATGLKDIMPEIQGFSECWGISVLHCPYCHGYEVRHHKTGIIANGDIAYHYAQLISNWTSELTVFTNGKSTLSPTEVQKLSHQGIEIVETEILSLEHNYGKVEFINLIDQSKVSLHAIYSAPETRQSTHIPEQLGCQLTDEGSIVVDGFQKTTEFGIYACGDNSNFRSVSLAVSTGSVAGIMANKDLIEETF